MRAPGNWTVEGLFAGRPEAYHLFGIVREHIESLGPVKIEASKTQISFALKTKFAWVWLPQMWIKKQKENSIVLTFDLSRHVRHDRIKQAVEPRPGRWTHHVVIEKQSDFDVDVEEWLREAFRLAETRNRHEVRKSKFSLKQHKAKFLRIVERTDHKTLAVWAIDCAERVLPYFEEEHPEDNRPRKAIETLQAWINTGAFKMADIRKASLAAHAAAREAGGDNAARSAARAAGQAVATAHVPTHSIGAAIYALQAIHRAMDSSGADALVGKERDWQYRHLLRLAEGSKQLNSKSMPMEEQLIAPCGMNCAVCSAYLALKHEAKSKGIRIPYCSGCRPRDKKCAFLNRRCQLLLNGQVEYCYECSDFPCERLRAVDQRYKTLFRMSMIENLEYIRKKSTDEFLAREQEKWKCPSCGGVICCHNGLCFDCGLDALRQRKQKYRWEKK